MMKDTKRLKASSILVTAVLLNEGQALKLKKPQENTSEKTENASGDGRLPAALRPIANQKGSIVLLLDDHSGAGKWPSLSQTLLRFSCLHGARRAARGTEQNKERWRRRGDMEIQTKNIPRHK